MRAFTPPSPDDLIGESTFTPPAPGDVLSATSFHPPRPEELEQPRLDDGSTPKMPAPAGVVLEPNTPDPYEEGMSHPAKTAWQVLNTALAPKPGRPRVGLGLGLPGAVSDAQMKAVFANTDTNAAPSKGQAIALGVAEGAQEIVRGFTSPIGIATLGIGGLPSAAQRMISLAFATQMASQTPEIAKELGTEFGKPEAERDWEKIAALSTQAAGTLGFTAMAAKHGLAPKAKPVVTEEPPEPFSEFGGEAEAGPGPEAPAAAAAPIEPTPPTTTTTTDYATNQNLETGADESGQTAEANREPAPESDASAEPPQELPAGPAPGAQPLSTIERKYLREAIAGREPVKVDLVNRAQAEGGFVLPEGYAPAGETFVYTEPPKIETPAARFAREQREASAALAKLRQQEAPPDAADAIAALRPLDRGVQPGVPFQTFDRPPDILDWIEEQFNGVKVPDTADFDTIRERIKGLSQNKAAEVSGLNLKRWFRGEPADTALSELNKAGKFGGAKTPEELFDKMIRAAQERIGWARQEKAARTFQPPEPGAGEEPSGEMSAEELAQYLAERGPGYGIDKTTAESVTSAYGIAPEQALQTLAEDRPYQPELALQQPAGAGAAGDRPGNPPVSGRRALAREALKTLTPEALAKAFQGRKKVSSIDPKSAPHAVPEFRINGTVIKSPGDFARTVISLRSPYSESLKIAILDENDVVVHSQVMSAGTLDTTVVDLRDFARLHDLHGKQGKRMVISHNHPSGDPTPSAEDIRFTDRIRKFAEKSGFEIVDHVITNGETYFSLRHDALMRLSAPGLAAWEQMPRSELQQVDDAAGFASLVKSLRQTNPDVAHIIYLNTRMKVSAIERVSPTQQSVWKALSRGIGVEGASKLMIDYGPTVPKQTAAAWTKVMSADLSGSTTRIVDFASQDVWSGAHLLSEAAPANALRETAAPDREAERATGLKITASPAISDPVKTAISEYLYQVRSNATDQTTADGLVKQFGVDQATETYRNPPAEMPGAVRSKLLGSITRTLVNQERAARASQDAAGAAAAADKQAKLWNEALPQITDMAQSLQALNDLISMSPDGHVARVRRRLEDVASQELESHRPEVEQARTAIEDGRAAGIEAVRRDPAVNGAARAAVDEAIGKDPEVHKAVVMDLAAPWSESPEIVKLTREYVRAKAEQMLKGAPAPVRQSPSQYLRQIMDDLAKRAAGIAATYFQGGVTHPKGLSGLLEQRLGLDEAHAGRMAAALDKEFEAQVKAAKAKLPKRIATMRATRERNAGAALNSPDNAVDAAIRRQLRGLNLKLGDVLKQEAGRQDANGRHVAERIVQASGLEGEAADVLRNRLENRWNTLVTDAQQRTLRALQANSGVTLTRPVRDAFARLVELDRLGALKSEQFYDVVKQSLKLKQLTDADAKELRRLVQRAQDLPEGFLRQRAANDVLQLTERLTGNQKWWDVPLAIFYANILSGLTTPAKIVFENTNMLAGNTLTEFLSRPTQNLLHPVEFGKHLVKAYGRGLVKGALQGESTLRTGVITGVWNRGRSNILESKPFGRFEPLNFWKYFTRVIGTAHETTFKPAWEVKQTMIARDVARREGLRGKALDQRVADLMANTAQDVAKAKGQALAELSAGGSKFNRMDLSRRTREILEQQRETNMPGSTEAARDFALRTAYLNEPYGFLGAIATGVRGMIEKSRRDFPMAGTLAKTQIPFTTVVANILNEKLNWTPVGAFRAAASHRTGKLYGRPILENAERSQLYAKAIVGTIAVGALADLFGQHIHGNGPASPQKRKQLQAAGWIPHSIEYHGRYYSYMNTPLALPMAVIGNLFDWNRYGKGDDADGVSRTAFAAKATANAIVSQGMLDSVRRLFEALGTESTSEGGDRLQKLAARTASSFVVPNLVQQVDRLFDPTVYDQTGMAALATSQIPFVRRENKPALNVLGEPVQSDPFHYWVSKQTKDPLWRLLAEKQAFIPEPSKSAIIGSRKFGPDYYRAITPDEYYDLIRESGPEIRSQLEDLLPQLKTMPTEEVQAIVNSIAQSAHNAAKAKLE